MKYDNNKPITPLSKFPTEAILYFYRKNRTCRTHYYGLTQRYSRKLHKYLYWKAGPSEPWLHTDGYTYNVPLYYELVDNVDPKDYTTITGNSSYRKGDKLSVSVSYLDFEFEGMYWRGTIDEIHAELAKRPHVNLNGNKAYRKWKMEWKKNKRK